MKRKEFCIILVKMRIFILVFISLSCLSINSQEIIFECNKIVEGDSLVQRKMDLVVMGTGTWVWVPVFMAIFFLYS